jgi:hypothetical protein
MKKIIVIVLALLVLTTTLTGCGNKQWFDTTYNFDRAIISLPNGEVVDGKVDSWTDYEDGDQIQVKINGKTYLVHSSDVVLIAE